MSKVDRLRIRFVFFNSSSINSKGKNGTILSKFGFRLEIRRSRHKETNLKHSCFFTRLGIFP